jgi:hypothetical protein
VPIQASPLDSEQGARALRLISEEEEVETRYSICGCFDPHESRH